jgi:hypothetical protein
MAVVNSEMDAEVLRYLYFKYGPAKVQRTDGEVFTEGTITEAPPEEITPTPELANAIIHIGFHDMFIEGETSQFAVSSFLCLRTFRNNMVPQYLMLKWVLAPDP